MNWDELAKDRRLVEKLRDPKRLEGFVARYNNIDAHPRLADVAAAEGVSTSQVTRWVRGAKAVCGEQMIDRASVHANRGGQGAKIFTDHVDSAPDGYKIRGVSTLVDGAGDTVMQWRKTTEDSERMAAILKEATEAWASKLPKAKPVALREKTRPGDLLNLYAITDYHLGGLAWDEECGANWDTEIAESLLMDWLGAAIAQSPNTDECVFLQMGDFLHIDNLTAVTPASGHILDADTRLQRIIRVAIRAHREVIRRLLEKHSRVNVIICEGNHDEVGSIWLREGFASHYENEPRVVVDQSADGFYCHKFGDVSLFFHHGHRARMKSLSEVFTARFREEYGTTKYSYAHCGHLHHETVLETGAMRVEQHPTLAARDAYAARLGLQAMRRASVIQYHKEYGEVGRVTVTPEMVR